QALRIEVNGELQALERALPQAVEALAAGGRLVVLSYHSGEDRLVKAAFDLEATGGCTCPPGLPCVCGARPRARLLRRSAELPTAGEIAQNARAESARLRMLERLAEPGPQEGGAQPGGRR
ncbi:MAG: 16S rRNA (cytosine(1402)-N(4))-methyltransferase, partial [Acidimicrobiales bacterium]